MVGMRECTFNTLRAMARERRDTEIKATQEEYEANIRAIAALEQDLCGKVSSRYRSISSAIESVIPADREFTTEDIMAALQAMDPARAWRKRSLDSYISRLRERGLVKRLCKANGTTRAVYARADLGPAAESRPIRAYIDDALTRPMTLTEITVAVVEAGFPTTMTRKNLRSYVGRELKDGGYRRSGERWSRS